MFLRAYSAASKKYKQYRSNIPTTYSNFAFKGKAYYVLK